MKKKENMTEKENMYFKLFGDKEYLTLKESCKIWIKPGYSTLSKKLPQVGYEQGVKLGLIPRYRVIGGTYLFKIADILNFLESTEAK